MVQLLQGGTVSQSYSYNAYGYINADAYGIHAPFFGYNGEEQNPFTGLQYLRARYYAPQNGGFITQDSFGGILTNVLSQNRYTYAENDPVNGIDPSGHTKRGRDDTGDKFKGGGGNKKDLTGPVGPTRQPSQTSRTSNSSGSGQSSKPPYTKPPAPPRPSVLGYMESLVTAPPQVAVTGHSRTSLNQRTGSVPPASASSVVSHVASQPYVTTLQAVGQANLLSLSLVTFTESVRMQMLQRGCDPSIQHYTNQNESSVLSTWREIYPYYAYFANMVGNSSLGRAIAFVQGELTAIGDDFAALSKSYTNLWKGSAQSDLWAYSGLDGYVYSSSTQYMPFFGHKNEMSFGRVVGHLLVALTGSAETAASFFGAGMLEGGGAVLAPETGGASLVASTAVSSTLIAVFGKQGISIAKEGVPAFSMIPILILTLLPIPFEHPPNRLWTIKTK